MSRLNFRTALDRLRLLPRVTLQLAGVVMLVSLISQLCMLAVPIYIFQLSDGALETRNYATLYFVSLMFVVAIVIAVTLRGLRQAVIQAAAATAERKLYLATLKAAVRLGREGRPELASVAVRDFDTLRRFLIGGSIGDVCDILLVPVPLTCVFLLHPLLGWVTLGFCVAVFLFSLVKERASTPLMREATGLSAKASSELGRRMSRRDEVIGLGLVHGIIRHWFPLKRQALLAEEAARGNSAALQGVTQLISTLSVSACFTLTALLIIRNEAAPGALIVGLLLVMTIVAPFDRITQHWATWNHVFVSFGRLAETMRLIQLPTVRRAAMPVPGVQVQGLRLEVPGSGRLLLEDLNLQAPPGTVIAITGRNGTGKSTLLRALVGLVRPAQGAVVYAGWTMHAAERGVVGPLLGLLSQRAQLLDETVMQNICRLTGDSEGAIQAARLCGAHEMIGRLPSGYSANAGSGAGLSGGQQRQIALARAFYGEPKLLVLDEPEVGLDPPALAALLAGVAEMRRRGAVVFLVTHDLRRWAGIADLELRLEGEGAWQTALLNDPAMATT